MSIWSLLFGTHGRINRFDWWIGQIIVVVLAIALSAIFHFSIPHDLSWQMFTLHNLSLGMVIGVFFIWSHVAINVKRWHDLRKPGWYVILNYIPGVGLLISIVILGFFKGKGDDG